MEISSIFQQRIDQANIIWLTTVRADGMPQPTPVWFIRENESFLIYSQPQAQKLKNIQHNPKVSLNLDSADDGEEYVVIMGEAAIIEDHPRSNQIAAYVEKYRKGIEEIGYTPDTLAQTWSVAIRVTPVQVRGQ